MAQTETNTSTKVDHTKVYNALMKGDEVEVIKLCRQIKEGPLHILTVNNDTVLHLASYCNQKKLIVKLLDCLSTSDCSKLVCQNKMGNTVLHEVASLRGLAPAAEEMLYKCPELLGVRNSCGETALFQAARFGTIDMYKFLDGEISRHTGLNVKDFHARNDKTNILHISILAEHFDLALLIVSNSDYKYLAGAKDDAGRTALQLLACNSSAFLSGSKTSSVKKTFYKLWSQAKDVGGEVKSCCRVPLCEYVQSEKTRYVSALKLAKVLIEEETCWDNTEPGTDGDIPGNPLILATKYGCTEIVREILDKYPHAVDSVNGDDHNILQVAIKYRRIEIFDLVTKKMVTKRLIWKIDNDGNSLLHLVGIREHHDDEAADMRTPVLRLQETLLLFEHVEKVSTTHFIKPENNEGKTAEMLLKESTAKLCNDAKEWTTRTAENCSIVSVLIATVAFAAIYTIPGGLDDDGFPNFLGKPFFITFIVADVLSLGFALSSVITFLSILTSSFRLRDFKLNLPQKLMMGVTLLYLSISMMMLAFAATVMQILINCDNKEKIGISVVAFLPVTIFVVSYLPLYASFAKKSFIYSHRKIGPAFRRCSIDHC